MAPLWIQAHGLQLRSMTNGVGEILGSIHGEVLEVKSDYDELLWDVVCVSELVWMLTNCSVDGQTLTLKEYQPNNL